MTAFLLAHVATTVVLGHTFYDLRRMRTIASSWVVAGILVSHQVLVGAVGLGWVHVPLPAQKPTTIWFDQMNP